MARKIVRRRDDDLVALGYIGAFDNIGFDFDHAVVFRDGFRQPSPSRHAMVPSLVSTIAHSAVENQLAAIGNSKDLRAKITDLDVRGLSRAEPFVAPVRLV